MQDNQIVLSISPSATKDLTIDNEWIHFHARFAGVSHEIWIPVGHVLGIFAKETGQGMGFEVEEWQPDESDEAAPAAAPESAETDPSDGGTAKVVKFRPNRG